MVVLVDSSPSYYGHVQVVRRHGLKLLLVNGIMQNQGADEREATLTYLPFFAALPVIREERGAAPADSLVIGLGGGQLPMMLMADGIGVEAVEIDPVIAAMARKHFALDMPEESLHITDGRVFLEQTSHRYDYIFMDAFNADQVPWHLLSREALALARSRLMDGGVVGLNAVALPGSEEVTALHATLSSVFEHVRVFNDSLDPGLSNIVFLASDAPIALVPFPRNLAPELADITLRYLGGEIHGIEGGLVLNDDFNPVNHLHEEARAQWRIDMRAFLGREYYDWAFY
jgi:spermidine synthase